MKKNNRFFSIIICLFILFSSLGFRVFAENDKNVSYTVSYGKGIYISYAGSEPKNFIKGDPPASQVVNQNGSVTVAKNTFTFRDYSFGGWKYTYTDENGKKKSLYYEAGDVIENINCNMKLEATWTKAQTDLKIKAYATYADSNDKTEHYIGEILVLKNAPSAPSSNYEFCGWTDNAGTVLYSPRDSYEIKNINTVIKPVWSVDGEKIDYQKITVNTTKGGKASISKIYILSGGKYDVEFTPDEGYYISDIKLNGSSKGAVSKLSVSVQNDDVYIDAVFSKIPTPEPPSSEDDTSFETSTEEKNDFEITVISEGNGSVSPEKNIKVKKGENITLKFTPEKEYRLPLEINDNNNYVFFSKDWNGEYVLENVEEDHVIKIFFISESSVVTPSIDDYSSKPSGEPSKTTKKFTKSICIFIIIIASFFGIASIIYANRNKKTKKKKKKKSNSKKRT